MASGTKVQLRLGERVVAEVAFDGAELRIGRMKENDLVINNLAVSRFHAVLRRVGDAFEVEDLGSENGTLLDGRVVSGCAPVLPGEAITIGKHTLVLRAAGDGHTRPPRRARSDAWDAAQTYLMAAPMTAGGGPVAGALQDGRVVRAVPDEPVVTALEAEPEVEVVAAGRDEGEGDDAEAVLLDEPEPRVVPATGVEAPSAEPGAESPPRAARPRVSSRSAPGAGSRESTAAPQVLELPDPDDALGFGEDDIVGAATPDPVAAGAPAVVVEADEVTPLDESLPSLDESLPSLEEPLAPLEEPLAPLEEPLAPLEEPLARAVRLEALREPGVPEASLAENLLEASLAPDAPLEASLAPDLPLGAGELLGDEPVLETPDAALDVVPPQAPLAARAPLQEPPAADRSLAVESAGQTSLFDFGLTDDLGLSDRSLAQAAGARSAQEPEPPRPMAPALHAGLIVERAGRVERVVSWEAAVLVVGRAPGCDLVLPGSGVSRQHARLVRDEGVHSVRDLGSANGVFVNGTRAESVVLSQGDVIRVDDYTLTFVLDRVPVAGTVRGAESAGAGTPRRGSEPVGMGSPRRQVSLPVSTVAMPERDLVLEADEGADLLEEKPLEPSLAAEAPLAETSWCFEMAVPSEDLPAPLRRALDELGEDALVLPARLRLVRRR